MAHPFRDKAKSTGKEKLRSLGGKTPHNESDMDRRLKGRTGPMTGPDGARAFMYPLKDGGQGSGEGRLDQAEAARKK